jgi:hypothetical protein
MIWKPKRVDAGRSILTDTQIYRRAKPVIAPEPIRPEHYEDVTGLNGKPLCRFCGNRRPKYDGVFCSRQCEVNYGQLGPIPSPREILNRAAECRAKWNVEEERLRWVSKWYVNDPNDD